MICNIIDHRSNPLRWKKVYAIIESTWHDNIANGADQAPANVDTDVTFAQLDNVTLTEAVIWANNESGPVTLYLYDVSPHAGLSRRDLDARLASKEVDAAARTLYGWGRSREWWRASSPQFDDLDPLAKSEFRFAVWGALTAAAKVRSQESALDTKSQT